jgi:cytochrome c oxidase subunit 2
MNFTDYLKHEILKLPPVGTEHGPKIDDFILYVHYLMVVLFIGWTAYFIYALFKFRATPARKAVNAGVGATASNVVEGAVIVAEAVLLIGFAIPLWAVAVEKFPEEKNAVNIRIIGEQFTWNARYAGADGKFGRTDVKFLSATNQFAIDYADPAAKDDVVPPAKDIRVPLGTNVIMHVSSKDVIHSFKVVGLRVCQDAIPGMSVPIHFKPTKPGKYLVTCAQLCGNGHATMNAYLTVERPEDFAKWYAERSKSGAATSFE